MALEVDDPDAVAAAMVAHGGRVLFPVTDHDYGQRAGRIADPFGHAWMVAAHTGDLTPSRSRSGPGVSSPQP